MDTFRRILTAPARGFEAEIWRLENSINKYLNIEIRVAQSTNFVNATGVCISGCPECGGGVSSTDVLLTEPIPDDCDLSNEEIAAACDAFSGFLQETCIIDVKLSCDVNSAQAQEEVQKLKDPSPPALSPPPVVIEPQGPSLVCVSWGDPHIDLLFGGSVTCKNLGAECGFVPLLRDTEFEVRMFNVPYYPNAPVSVMQIIEIELGSRDEAFTFDIENFFLLPFNLKPGIVSTPRGGIIITFTVDTAFPLSTEESFVMPGEEKGGGGGSG